MWKASNVHRIERENQHTSSTHKQHIYRAWNAENIACRWRINRTMCNGNNVRRTSPEHQVSIKKFLNNEKYMTSLENIQPSISRNWKDRRQRKDIYGQFYESRSSILTQIPPFTMPFAKTTKRVAVTRCS